MDLITGGSGYFGSTLVRHLAAKDRKVRVLDLNDSPDRPDHVEFVRADIRQAKEVEKALEGVSRVFHNTAQVPLAKRKDLFWSVNYGGTQILLEACHKAGTEKIIYTSSSAIYGIPESNPVDEATPESPMESYGESKVAAEKLCRDFIAKGLDISIIRPRTIMGEGRLGIMQILFEWIKKGQNVPVLGKGENIYQFVHQDDLADACLKAAGLAGADVFNIGGADFCTMRETIQGLIDHAGTGSRIVSLPLEVTELLLNATINAGMSPFAAYHALMYGRSLYFDITKSTEILNWTPRYGNIEMFCQSYDWYVKHRNEILAGRGSSPHRSSVKQGILSAGSLVLNLLPALDYGNSK